MQNQRPPRLAFSFLAGLFQRLPPRLGRLRSATGTAGGGGCTRRRGGGAGGWGGRGRGGGESGAAGSGKALPGAGRITPPADRAAVIGSTRNSCSTTPEMLTPPTTSSTAGMQGGTHYGSPLTTQSPPFREEAPFCPPGTAVPEKQELHSTPPSH